MRRLLFVLATVMLIACGGDSATAPQNGTVYFKVDALTCTGSGQIALVIDGSIVGTETLAAGQQSQGYVTPAGQHILGARETASGGFVWPNQTATVPANSTYTAVLTC